VKPKEVEIGEIIKAKTLPLLRKSLYGALRALVFQG
jgi:hypothetical protein